MRPLFFHSFTVATCLLLIAITFPRSSAAQIPSWEDSSGSSETETCLGSDGRACADCSVDQGSLFPPRGRVPSPGVERSFVPTFSSALDGRINSLLQTGRPEVVIGCVPDAPPTHIAKACKEGEDGIADCVVKLGPKACDALGLTPRQGLRGTREELIQHIKQLLAEETDAEKIIGLIQILHELQHCKDFVENIGGCKSEVRAFDLEIELLEEQMTRFKCGTSSDKDPEEQRARCQALRKELEFAQASRDFNQCACDSESVQKCRDTCVNSCKKDHPKVKPEDCERLGLYCREKPKPTNTPTPSATPGGGPTPNQTPPVVPTKGPTPWDA